VSGIVVVLISLLGVALGRATESARLAASQRGAEAIAAAVEQFEERFGFLPPLVHDGPLISAGDTQIMPEKPDGTRTEGPLEELNANEYDFRRIVAWVPNTTHNLDFLRRRSGTIGSDPVALEAGGGAWSIDDAWDDRRYSRYALAYYLTGALGRDVDGVAGEGMARPSADGSFVGVGYPVGYPVSSRTLGATRDRSKTLLDTDSGAIDVRTGYARPADAIEHGAASVPPDALRAGDVYALYDAAQLDDLVALVDNFGNAYRYYRWEHGRLNNEGRLVVETTLDLNIPPVLLDPVLVAQLQNDDNNPDQIDLTAGDPALRSARFAIVGAGADGVFGTEPIGYLASALGAEDPGGDEAGVVELRTKAMEDNVVALGD